ncbi:MAG: CCA tRNA nucleotidyltransferase [Chloroflexi bacterium]|nr:CCA tRNA nucleotidyltransferase [Chloroflexota bacterium]
MTNIATTLLAQLDNTSLRQLRGIAAVAEIHGAQTYLVGGAVRDALLGLPVADIDITVVGMTSGLPRGVARALNGRVVAHSQFNTFAINAAGRHIDLAMARHESYTQPGALPTVVPGTIQQDLARRDFTINAMAVSISTGSFGDLLDPFQGQADLEAGKVRVLHDESFRDDATRILRAARYAVRLGIELEAHTEQILRRDASYLDTISPSRLRDEYMRVLREGRAVSTIEMLHTLGALRPVHPALTLSGEMLAALRRAEQTTHADTHLIYLCLLSHSLSQSERQSLIIRLALSSDQAEAINDTGFVADRIPELEQELSRSEIYLCLREFSEASILACALISNDSAASQSMMLLLDELRHIRTTLNGNDLVALGVPQGPRVGVLLHELLVARIDNEVKTRQDEIDFIQARL